MWGAEYYNGCLDGDSPEQVFDMNRKGDLNFIETEKASTSQLLPKGEKHGSSHNKGEREVGQFLKL